MKEAAVEEQIQWVLLYIQEKSAYIWKENILEDLEIEALEYVTVGEFLADLKKEIKVTELKKVKQETRTIKEFF